MSETHCHPVPPRPNGILSLVPLENFTKDFKEYEKHHSAPAVLELVVHADDTGKRR